MTAINKILKILMADKMCTKQIQSYLPIYLPKDV